MMRHSILLLLQADYRPSIERLFDRLNLTGHHEEEEDLPELHMQYMIDDYADLV